MNSTKQKDIELLAFCSSHQGESHKRTGKVCQDAAFARFKEIDRYAVAIVSDGHGGDNYFRSDRGSRLAVEATQEAVGEFMNNFLKASSLKKLSESKFHAPDDLMRQLETAILYRWRTKIQEDYVRQPFTAEELACFSAEMRKRYESSPNDYFVKAYGATLIAVVVYPEQFWFGLHIGDGKCVAQKADGICYQPIPWDDKCFLNVTTSLCDEKPLENFRHCFHTEDFPAAIFVGTDGVDDCFANDTDLYGFYQEVVRTFREKKYKKACREIDEFLPLMSARGSGDDISVSGIINK